MREPKRIPYDTWINSQLSIARFYGGCTINGVRYVLDYDNCPTKGEGDDKKYFPDLVEVINKRKEDRPSHPPTISTRLLRKERKRDETVQSKKR